MIDKIFKFAKIEAEWIKYYCHIDSKHLILDILTFYDKALPIGYSKVYTPLHLRCPISYINSLTIDSSTKLIYGPRNHENNIYTCLEFVIYNKVDGYLNLIKIITK